MKCERLYFKRGIFIFIALVNFVFSNGSMAQNHVLVDSSKLTKIKARPVNGDVKIDELLIEKIEKSFDKLGDLDMEQLNLRLKKIEKDIQEAIYYFQSDEFEKKHKQNEMRLRKEIQKLKSDQFRHKLDSCFVFFEHEADKNEIQRKLKSLNDLLEENLPKAKNIDSEEIKSMVNGSKDKTLKKDDVEKMNEISLRFDKYEAYQKELRELLVKESIISRETQQIDIDEDGEHVYINGNLLDKRVSRKLRFLRKKYLIED